MEVEDNSNATNVNIGSKANSEFNQESDHKSTKKTVIARKHIPGPYLEDRDEFCNQDNEIIMEDSVKKCKLCANCDNKKKSEVKPKVTVEISMMDNVSESKN